jgi:3-deoxy-D-manno-octulosonate 8-phosphate phosphatase (KDO 8-P phosphatase)
VDTALAQELRSLQAIVFDFDGVFTDNSVVVDQNGVESVRCWRSDGIGLSRIQALGLKTVIISTEKNPVVSARARKMGTECIQGVDDKAAAIVEWSNAAGVSLSHTAFVGNDVNDIPALQKVGLPIGVADSYEEVSSFVKYITVTAGGYGAVREVCDLVVHARAVQLEI